MDQTSTLTLIFIFTGFLASVSGYSSGQISIACDSMLPQHGSNSPQSSTAPYAITVSKNTFNPGDNITVTLTANGGHFKGFLLEPQLVGGNGITGTFRTTDSNAQILTCGASHNNGNAKQSITAVWTAPEGAGPIVFVATVVQAFTTYWTGVKSEIVSAVSNIKPENEDLIYVDLATGQMKGEACYLQISNTTCGTQKFCFSLPNGCSPSDSNCLFMSSSPSSNGTGYVFEMSGSALGYVAIGFSDDTTMGNDDVYICTTNSAGNVLVQHAYNTGKTFPTISNSNTAGSVVASYVNGVVKCSFITQSAISTQQRATTGSSYYVFLVKGALLASGQIQKHDLTLISSTKVDISSYLPTTTLTVQRPLVRGHGALMLIAWMATGSIGMIMARYMKSSAGKPFLGKALWFQTHFYLMILTVILTIIAFIMIFVEVAGWSSFAGAHPVLGCIVMILSFFQPIAAFFRPDPKSDRRFIFNWAHRINALVIKVLAVATIFLGLNLVDMSANQWMPKVMGGYFAWEVLFYVILEITMQLKTKNTYEITDERVQTDTVVLMVFIFGNLAFLIALLVGIGSS
ncbi:putative ferric-chelate reductase 1 [Gastrophryne carolinensis]